MAMNIMIQGTMSNAGKSLLAAGLCRVLKQDGYRVAPFKSQNMALNSFITRDGGEMGRAQVVQAEAAGIEPDTRMNPILLKPTTDVGSQVIVNGQVRGNMQAMEYFRRKRDYIPAVLEAYNSLASEYDVIVIEGAGSPAEINLKQDDIVNMGLAKLVDAPVLLVGDIDRGGVFAQLYGTVALLEEDERRRIKGVVVNKFRGDRAILEPGLKTLQRAKTPGYCGNPRAAHLQFHGFQPFRTLRKRVAALCGSGERPAPAGHDPAAGYQEHHCRPAVAAAVRSGGGHPESGRRRYADLRRLRRLPDAGAHRVRP